MCLDGEQISSYYCLTESEPRALSRTIADILAIVYAAGDK